MAKKSHVFKKPEQSKKIIQGWIIMPRDDLIVSASLAENDRKPVRYLMDNFFGNEVDDLESINNVTAICLINDAPLITKDIETHIRIGGQYFKNDNNDCYDIARSVENFLNENQGKWCSMVLEVIYK